MQRKPCLASTSCMPKHHACIQPSPMRAAAVLVGMHCARTLDALGSSLVCAGVVARMVVQGIVILTLTIQREAG